MVMRLQNFVSAGNIVIIVLLLPNLFSYYHSLADESTSDRHGTVMNKQSLSLCNRSDIRRGAWVARMNDTGDLTTSPTQYRWLPDSSCQFQEEFNSTLFCNLMANAVIMFIGDSITWEMFASLIHFMGGHVSKTVHTRAIFRRGLPVLVNHCGHDNVTFIYRHSKHLTGVGTSVSIGQMLQEQFPTMIVLNTGAHVQPDNAYRSNVGRALEQMRGWQGLCRDRNLTCPFFWRTSSPGIPNCMQFTKPVNNITKMEEYVAANPTYGWEKMRYQNKIALHMLELMESTLSYQIIDGYEIGIQRPETRTSEQDCLHNADNPAIADASNIVLLHYLRSSRTIEDISRIKSFRYDFSRVSNVRSDGKDFDWNIVNG